MTANIEISSVTLTPSTVVTGAQFIISAIVDPRKFALATLDGRVLTTGDNKVLTTLKEKG